MHAAYMMAFNFELVCAECSNCPDIGRMFLLENAVGQGFFCIIIVDRHSHLCNDGAVVEAGTHEMDSASCHFHPCLYGLPLGMESAETGKKGWMDIENFVWECMDKVFPADPHISGQADEVRFIGLCRLQDGLIEGILIFKRFQFQHRRRDSPAGSSPKHLGIGMVADDSHHGTIDGTIDGGFVDRFRIGTAAGSKIRIRFLLIEKTTCHNYILVSFCDFADFIDRFIHGCQNFLCLFRISRERIRSMPRPQL